MSKATYGDNLNQFEALESWQIKFRTIKTEIRCDGALMAHCALVAHCDALIMTSYGV